MPLLEKYLKHKKSKTPKEVFVRFDGGNMDDFDPKVIDQFLVTVIIVFAGIILGLSLYIVYS